MSSRLKTLKLARGTIGGREVFRILAVKNSTNYKPGEDLCKVEVDDLIQHGSFDVTIVELMENGGPHAKHNR